MSALDDHLDQPPETLQLLQPEQQSSARSPLDMAKAVLHAKAGEKNAWIVVPETGGLVVVKYRWLSGAETDKLQAQALTPHRGRALTMEVAAKAQRQVAIDVLIEACEAVCVRRDTSVRPEEAILIDEDGLGPCQFDQRLCEALDLQTVAQELGLGVVESAVDTVRALFHDNDQAIADHSQRLQRWFVDRESEADREFWG